MKKIANKGFTLIELLVVVAIIAILALVVLLALNPAEMARRSRDSRRLSDLGTLRRAVDLTIADGKTLAVTGGTGGWVTLTTGMTNGLTAFAGMTGFDISKYLSIVPQDPLTGVAGTTQNIDTTACTAVPGVANSTMLYEFKSNGDVYELRAHLESTDNCGAVKNDGLNDAYYELGTAPNMGL